MLTRVLPDIEVRTGCFCHRLLNLSWTTTTATTTAVDSVRFGMAANVPKIALHLWVSFVGTASRNTTITTTAKVCNNIDDFMILVAFSCRGTANA